MPTRIEIKLKKNIKIEKLLIFARKEVLFNLKNTIVYLIRHSVRFNGQKIAKYNSDQNNNIIDIINIEFKDLPYRNT